MSNRRRRALVIAASLATASLFQPSAEGIVTWQGAHSSDLNDPLNWLGGVLPAATDEVNFIGAATTNFSPTINGTFTSGYFQLGDDSLTPTTAGYATSGGGPWSFAGTGTIVISSQRNIDTFGATGSVNFAVSDLQLTRAAALYGASGVDGSGNPTGSSTGVLSINTTSFHVGVGASSGTPSFNAVGADINITPAVDFSLSTVNRGLALNVYGHRTITLTNGFTSSSRLTAVTVGGTATSDGAIGTVVITNSSPSWAGSLSIQNANLPVNNANVFGLTSAIGNNYTEIGSLGTGALQLSGGISTGEYIYLDARNPTAAAPVHLRNVSGNTTLSGTIELENGSATPIAGNTSYGISSDGTAAGDILRLNNITSSVGENIDGGGGSAVLAFRGAGNGIVNGNMTEQTGGTPPQLHSYNVEKRDAGTWTFAGTNSYSGATTVYGGTLRLASTAVHTGGFNYTLNGGSLIVNGSLTTSSVIANPGTVMGGTGTIHADTFISGAAVNPGDGGVGALSIKSLAFDNAANAMNIDLGASGVDKVTVLDPDGLQFLGGAGTVVINPTSLGSVVNGAYQLVDYNGTPLNVGSFSSFSLGTTSIGGLTLALQNNTRATSVDLVVTGGVGLNAQWNVDANGNWTAASNWNPNLVPNGQDQIANFGSIISSQKTVTLNSADGAQTVGVMNFSPTGTDGSFYTIAGTGTVILNSSSGTGTINNSSGTNVIGTGSLTLQLASNAVVNVANADTSSNSLAIGAKITGTGALNKTGPGLLILSNSNSFSGGLTLSAGTLQVSDNNQLGAVSSSVTFAGGTLQGASDLTLPVSRNIQVGASGGALDANGFTMTVNSPLSGSGALSIAGDGTVSISSSLSGLSTVNKIGIGTLAFSSSASLNGFAQSAGTTIFATNTPATSFILSGGTLSGAGGVTLNTGSYDLRGGTVATPLNGSAGANISTGTVTYTGNNGYTGNTTLASGVLVASSSTALGGASNNLVFNGGALSAGADITLPATRGVVLNAVPAFATPEIVYNNHTLTINGPVSGTGGLRMDQVGATLVLAASNSFSGNIAVTQGTLRVTDSNAVPVANTITLYGNSGTNAVSGQGQLQLAGNILYSAPISLFARQGINSYATTIDNLSGNNTIAPAAGIVASGGGGQYNFAVDSGKLTVGTPTTTGLFLNAAGVRTLNDRGPGDLEFAGTVGEANTVTGQWTVVQYSSGNLTFSASDNYRLSTLMSLGGGTMTFASTFGNTETGAGLTAFVSIDDVNQPNRVQLSNNSTLDISNSPFATSAIWSTIPIVAGTGTIKGNLTANAITTSIGNLTTLIKPGDTAELDAGGAIDLIYPSGVGKLTVTGNTNLSAGGQYEWSLGSLTTSGAGTNYDQLALGGTTTLGGTSALNLDFSLLAAGNAPVVDPSVAGTNAFWTSGHQWKIIDITGAGTNSTLLPTINNFNNDSGPAYFKETLGIGADAGDVLLNYAVSIKGDANRDGKVNAIDFNILATNYGTVQQKWSLGDFDGSGTVDSADFTLLSMHFGQTSVAPAPGLGSLVPEPTSLGLLGAAAVFGMRRRRASK